MIPCFEKNSLLIFYAAICACLIGRKKKCRSTHWQQPNSTHQERFLHW